MCCTTLSVQLTKLELKNVLLELEVCMRVFSDRSLLIQTIERPLNAGPSLRQTYCYLRSSDPFYIVSCYIKWVTTSWTYTKNFSLSIRSIESYYWVKPGEFLTRNEFKNCSLIECSTSRNRSCHFYLVV